MNWHLGTMGFSYDDWAGPFYPLRTPSAQYLSFFATQFNAVELDTTFYAIPPVERVRKWHDATPPAFRFCAKVPRTVTHELPTPGAVDELRTFVDVMRTFGDKLGVLLLQFPPSFAIGQFPKLEALLLAAPKDVRFAVELRDRSWGTPRTLELLSHHRAALVHAEYRNPPRLLPVTAGFRYVRWVGEHERYVSYQEEQVDFGDRLAWWKEKLLAPTDETIADVFGFFNNDYAGYAIGTCERFKRLIGQPVGVREVEKGLFD
jgi:uncharacterized protein YecE (DUF72 family)